MDGTVTVRNHAQTRPQSVALVWPAVPDLPFGHALSPIVDRPRTAPKVAQDLTSCYNKYWQNVPLTRQLFASALRPLY